MCTSRSLLHFSGLMLLREVKQMTRSTLCSHICTILCFVLPYIPFQQSHAPPCLYTCSERERYITRGNTLKKPVIIGADIDMSFHMRERRADRVYI